MQNDVKIARFYLNSLNLTLIVINYRKVQFAVSILLLAVLALNKATGKEISCESKEIVNER